ncbi:MAG: universal stress protein [Candidatus Nitrosopolaris sp.]
MVGGVAVKKILAAIDRSKYNEKIIADTVEKAIIDYAQDVILIGTTGMSIAEKVFLGSVANNVIHHAHCPVFAIR